MSNSWQGYEIDDAATRQALCAHINDELFHQIQRKHPPTQLQNQPISKSWTVSHLLSFMGTKRGTRGYANGIGMMSAKERTAAGEKGYAIGIGAMPAVDATSFVTHLDGGSSARV